MKSIFNPDRRSIVAAGRRVADPSPSHRRHHHPDFDRKGLQGWRAVHRGASLPQAAWKAEQERAVRMGLPGAESIEDRGELPHYAGINTFLKAPYVEDVRDAGKYDVAILGAPFDGGTTFRPGTRFGPQAIRRISALSTPYNFEIGVDLREQMTMCDLGDVFTIPANLEKTFDQITRAVAHVFSQGALPVILGGDHSIGFPTMRGIAQCTSRRIGIIHFDRHADIQERDLDERMHTTPWFHTTNLPNVPASNLVQIGIGGWQVPREEQTVWVGAAIIGEPAVVSPADRSGQRRVVNRAGKQPEARVEEGRVDAVRVHIGDALVRIEAAGLAVLVLHRVGGDDALTRPDPTDTADAALGGADRMLLDDKTLLAVFALYDTRRAIAEIGIHVEIPQVEWFEDVAVGVDDVIGTTQTNEVDPDRATAGAAC